MPATEADVFAVLVRLGQMSLGRDGNCDIRAVLERVSSSPQMGVVSAFTFGRGVGVLRMGLTCAEIPFDEVVPRVWQQAMGCLSRGDKNVTRRRAQGLFPTVVVTHSIADALLLAAFCRRREIGTP